MAKGLCTDTEFWLWGGSHYTNIADEMLRSRVWQFLDGAVRPGKSGKQEPFKPSGGHVSNVSDAFKAVTQLDGGNPPFWIGGGEERPPATELAAVGNGLLHLPTWTVRPATPEFFGLNASEVIFDRNAAEPALWKSFLRQVLEDQESIDLVQEWFGYTLTRDTS